VAGDEWQAVEDLLADEARAAEAAARVPVAACQPRARDEVDFKDESNNNYRRALERQSAVRPASPPPSRASASSVAKLVIVLVTVLIGATLARRATGRGRSAASSAW
jgi:hypothetical protein